MNTGQFVMLFAGRWTPFTIIQCDHEKVFISMEVYEGKDKQWLIGRLQRWIDLYVHCDCFSRDKVQVHDLAGNYISIRYFCQ